MKEDLIGTWIFGACCVAFMIGFVVGSIHCKRVLDKKAVDAGVAKYVVNEKTGETLFIFITNNAAIK